MEGWVIVFLQAIILCHGAEVAMPGIVEELLPKGVSKFETRYDSYALGRLYRKPVYYDTLTDSAKGEEKLYLKLYHYYYGDRGPSAKSVARLNIRLWDKPGMEIENFGIDGKFYASVEPHEPLNLARFIRLIKVERLYDETDKFDEYTLQFKDTEKKWHERTYIVKKTSVVPSVERSPVRNIAGPATKVPGEDGRGIVVPQQWGCCDEGDSIWDMTADYSGEISYGDSARVILMEVEEYPLTKESVTVEIVCNTVENYAYVFAMKFQLDKVKVSQCANALRETSFSIEGGIVEIDSRDIDRFKNLRSVEITIKYQKTIAKCFMRKYLLKMYKSTAGWTVKLIEFILVVRSEEVLCPGETPEETYSGQNEIPVGSTSTGQKDIPVGSTFTGQKEIMIGD